MCVCVRVCVRARARFYLNVLRFQCTYIYECLITSMSAYACYYLNSRDGHKSLSSITETRHSAGGHGSIGGYCVSNATCNEAR